MTPLEVVAGAETIVRAADAGTRFIGLLGQLARRNNRVQTMTLNDADVAVTTRTRDGGVVVVFDGYVPGSNGEFSGGVVALHFTKSNLPHVAQALSDLAKENAAEKPAQPK